MCMCDRERERETEREREREREREGASWAPDGLVNGGELAAPADDALHVLPQEQLPTRRSFSGVA